MGCHPPAYRSAGCSRTARRAGRASISKRAARAYLEPGRVPEQVQGPGADHTGVPRRDRASFLHDTQTASRGNAVGSLGVKLNAAPGAPLRGQVLACHLLRRRPHGRPQPVILRQHPGTHLRSRIRQPRKWHGEPEKSGDPGSRPGRPGPFRPFCLTRRHRVRRAGACRTPRRRDKAAGAQPGPASSPGRDIGSGHP